jgi:hypothetical protein
MDAWIRPSTTRSSPQATTAPSRRRPATGPPPTGPDPGAAAPHGPSGGDAARPAHAHAREGEDGFRARYIDVRGAEVAGLLASRPGELAVLRRNLALAQLPAAA